MSQIANCPICGKRPISYAAQEGLLCKIECCDHSIANPIELVKKWNQYSAAMESARSRARYAHAADSFKDDELQEMWDEVSKWNKLVLEVFGGEA